MTSAHTRAFQATRGANGGEKDEHEATSDSALLTRGFNAV